MTFNMSHSCNTNLHLECGSARKSSAGKPNILFKTGATGNLKYCKWGPELLPSYSSVLFDARLSRDNLFSEH